MKHCTAQRLIEAILFILAAVVVAFLVVRIAQINNLEDAIYHSIYGRDASGECYMEADK